MPEPRSEVNVGDVQWIGRVDCLDPVLPLIAEIDNTRFHVAPLDEASDERRDEKLRRAGFEVEHFKEHEVWYDKETVARRWRDARNRVRRSRAS
jgi:very-short-patch-repair endonuclease